MNKFALSFLSLSCLVFVSCTKAPVETPRATVEGKVIGEKLDGLGIVFSDGSTAESIPLNADGTFSGNAPVGDNVVYLYGAPSADASPDGGHADSKSSGIKAAFWDIETSPWKATVTPEGNTGLEFSLDAEVAGPAGAGHGGR